MATIALILGTAVGAAPVAAQRVHAAVRVRVVDTTGAAVSGADVAVLHGLADVKASGTTDAAGVRQFVVPRGGDELQVVVRRIGFRRGDHFFRADRDTVALVIRLRTAPQQLAAVQVTAAENLRTQRYHVTADDIADSKRPINNGLDVVTKLRRDMMDPPGQGIFTRCGLYDVWVNGARIVFPPIDPGIAINARQQRSVARSTPHMGIRGQASVPVSVQSVLASIHPEHIAEMNYVACRDKESSDMPHGQNAVFVALKPGVGFSPGRGSYVVDAAISQTFRSRLLGLFDAMTGDAIPDAEVVDSATGTFARTTPTGTVALAFLPEGASTLVIRRPGYAELRLDVVISPRDTTPLALLLTPKPR